jgi:nucleoside-diphosphate-sugar epimerase
MKYLVTGGGGFLGKALCAALRAEGHAVVSVSRGEYPVLRELGVECVRHDLSAEYAPLVEAMSGVDGVFHTAAKVDMWGKYADFYAINVEGTRNVVRACQQAKVPRLVYTSSPSVIADGTNLRGIDESYPYPKAHEAFYPATKAIAEQEVLRANSEQLATLALRPHLIFGPGDTNLIPTVLEKARNGALVQVGAGKNKVDFCYIDDCVAAHVGAMRALEERASARGRAYFVSQGDPVLMWEWIAKLLEYHGCAPVTKRVPLWLAHALAGFSEFSAKVGLVQEPRLTRFLVSEMATDHWFDISAARNELGYQPRYGVFEALEKTFAV